MTEAKETFAENSTNDWKAWDCNAMYPKPKEEDSKSNWIGGVNRAAKTGFDVYNKVKTLIPGGTKAGAGKVPGSPESMELEIIEMTGNEEVAGKGTGFEEIAGKGKKIWAAIGSIVGKKDADIYQ